MICRFQGPHANPSSGAGKIDPAQHRQQAACGCQMLRISLAHPFLWAAHCLRQHLQHVEPEEVAIKPRARTPYNNSELTQASSSAFGEKKGEPFSPDEKRCKVPVCMIISQNFLSTMTGFSQRGRGPRSRSPEKPRWIGSWSDSICESIPFAKQVHIQWL